MNINYESFKPLVDLILKIVKKYPKITAIILLYAIYSAYWTFVDWRNEVRYKEYTQSVKLGFSSVEEMNSMIKKGFKSKNDFFEAEAKKLGFENDAQKKEMNLLGINNGKELEEANAKMKSLGFYSLKEMKEIQAAGYNTRADKEAADKKIEELRVAKEKACQVDAKCLMQYGEYTAAYACASRADNYLRIIAKYNFKWDDEAGTKFDSFLLQQPSKGVVTLISDRISLQNGFGAYQRIKLYCNYDFIKHEVVSFSN